MLKYKIPQIVTLIQKREEFGQNIQKSEHKIQK